jgi:DNA-binding response OmpR family regulator
MADSKRKVLVVDDEPSIAKILRKQLEVAGFEVNVGVDGEDGLAKVREWRPELVLLDVMLPKINGHDVCKMLKADPELKGIPVIMLTAKTQRQDQDLAQQQGADGFLTKPFQLSELLAKVKGLLGPSPAA